MLKNSSKYNFLPIIIGSDINAYTMTRSFHEHYGVKPVMLAKAPLPVTSLSKLYREQVYNEGIEDIEVYYSALIKIIEKYSRLDKTIEKFLVVATNDKYQKNLIFLKYRLPANVLTNVVSPQLFDRLYNKRDFYKTAAEYGIPTPITYYWQMDDKRDLEDMPYPLIIKPADGIQYYKHEFEGLQKLFLAKTPEKAREVIDTIYKSGYSDELILQEYIEGDDSGLFDSVYYGSSSGKAQLMTFGQVMLQEHTKTAIGNYVAMINRKKIDFLDKLVAMMEDLKYTGFANFDMKYDKKTSSFKVFEVNLRQGRLSFYIESMTKGLAPYFVDDLINGKEEALLFPYSPQVTSYAPVGVLKKYIPNEDIKKEGLTLIKEGHFSNPLKYKNEPSLRHKLYILARDINYFRKYKRTDG